MDKFIITDNQKERLKELLTDEEFNKVIKLEWEEFSCALSGCISVRYIDDEPTAEADKIEEIYDDLYKQNLPNAEDVKTMKVGKDGKICAINDNPPTEEEIKESLANTPP